jgi:hypothetical protein
MWLDTFTSVFCWFKNKIGLINDPYLWKVTGFIILVAVVGNFLEVLYLWSKLAR